jgi:hypothetical protein
LRLCSGFRCEAFGGVALIVVNPAGLPDSALKTAWSLVELILAHLARQKTWPSLGAGLQPNAANEFTRGGFLESAEQANPLPGWPREEAPAPASRQLHFASELVRDQSQVYVTHHRFSAQSAALSRSLCLQENLPV